MSNHTGTKQVKDQLNNNQESLTVKSDEVVKNLKSQAQDKIEAVGSNIEALRDKVSTNLSGVAEAVHTKADTAQEFLDNKTDKFSDYAHQAIGVANTYGHRAAGALETSSEYVKKIDINETGQQLKNTLQKPQVGLAVAGILGIFVGLLIGKVTRQ